MGDERLLVQGIARMLDRRDRFEVEACASSAEEGINTVAITNPDVILMDSKLKTMSGLEACIRIKASHPEAKIILLSGEVQKELLSAGIRCGINGCLDKDIDEAKLFAAIECVHGGGNYFTTAFKQLVFEDFYTQEKSKDPASLKLPGHLTKRESKILKLVAEGKSSQEIGNELFISIKTVDTHKSNILSKLGMKNRAELVRYAIKHNIITV